MVWEHGAYVLVSLGLPDTKEKVRGVEGQDVWLWEWGQGEKEYMAMFGQGMGGEFGS